MAVFASLNCGALSSISCAGLPLLAINRLSASRNCSAVMSLTSSKWMALTVTQVKRHTQTFFFELPVGCKGDQNNLKQYRWREQILQLSFWATETLMEAWRVHLEIFYRHHSHELLSLLQLFLEESNTDFLVELAYEKHRNERVFGGILWWVMKWNGSFWEEVLDKLPQEVVESSFHGNEEVHHEVESQVDFGNPFCSQFHSWC